MGYIRAVIPLEDYRVRMEFNTGSSVTVDLSPKLKTARFAELADQGSLILKQLNGEKTAWKSYQRILLYTAWKNIFKGKEFDL